MDDHGVGLTPFSSECPSTGFGNINHSSGTSAISYGLEHVFSSRQAFCWAFPVIFSSTMYLFTVLQPPLILCSCSSYIQQINFKQFWPVHGASERTGVSSNGFLGRILHHECVTKLWFTLVCLMEVFIKIFKTKYWKLNPQIHGFSHSPWNWKHSKINLHMSEYLQVSQRQRQQ